MTTTTTTTTTASNPAKTQPPTFKFLPWQQTILDAKLDKQQRIVDVVVDIRGGEGLSWLGFLLEVEGKGHLLPRVRDRRSLLRFVRMGPPRSLYLVDIPRVGLNKKQMIELIAGIGEIKNGYIITGDCFTDSPRVWVFCSHAFGKMLSTRGCHGQWRFWRINDAMQLVSVDLTEFQ